MQLLIRALAAAKRTCFKGLEVGREAERPESNRTREAMKEGRSKSMSGSTEVILD